MKVVRNSIIPFRCYIALTLWPFIFVRKDMRVDDATMRHEEIHGRQQKEMLIVFFLMWYAVEWLVRLVIYGKSHKAYRMISFEQEAYLNEYDKDYLKKRRLFAWMKYIV